MAVPAGSRGRALRDLIPATLTTAAAGLAAAVLVASLTEGVETAFAPGVRAAPTYAAEPPPAAGAGTAGRPGGAAGNGVTVRVRPSRPRPLGVVAALDPFLPADIAVRSSVASRDAFDAPSARGLVLAAATAGPPATGVVPPTPVAPDAPAVVPAPTVTDVAPPAARDASSSRSKARRKAAHDGAPLTAASTDRVAFGPPAPDASVVVADDESTPRRRTPHAPPDHAPAYGHRR